MKIVYSGSYGHYGQEKILKSLAKLKKNYDKYPIDTTTVTHDLSAFSEDLIEYCKEQLLDQGLDPNTITITSSDMQSCRASLRLDWNVSNYVIKYLEQKLNFSPMQLFLVSKQAIRGVINHEITHIKEHHIIEEVFFNELYKEWKKKYPEESTVYIEQALQEHSYSCEYIADQLLSLDNYTNAQAVQAFFQHRNPTKVGIFCFLATVASIIATYRSNVSEYVSEDQKFISAWCLSSSTWGLAMSIFAYYIYTKDQESHPSDKKRNEALKKIMHALAIEEKVRKDICLAA